MTIPSNVTKASLYAIGAFFCMAVFAILTKLALQTSSVIWVSFIAYLSGSMALLPYIAFKGIDYLKSEKYHFLLGRALFGTLASFLYSISMHYIPIVNATLLFNTAPIFIPLLSLLFLKTSIPKSIWLAVGIGFIGIIIIIHPTIAIFSQAGNLIALGSGILLAIAYLLMKLLTATDPGIRIIFYYLGIGTFIQIPLLLMGGEIPSMNGFIYALLSGLTLLVAQIALVTGYKYAEASQVGIYQYSTVVFVGLLNWLLWKSIPTLWELGGMLLVAIAGMIIIRSNHTKA